MSPLVVALVGAVATLVAARQWPPPVRRRPVMVEAGERDDRRRRTLVARRAGDVDTSTRGGRSDARRSPLRRRPGLPVALVGLVAIVVVGPVAAVGVLASSAVPAARRRWRARAAGRAREVAVVDELPDVVDLLTLGTSSGLTLRLAVEAVAAFGHGAVAGALGDAVEHARRGGRLAEGLEGARRLGPSAHALVDALVAAERYGTPLGPTLERIGIDARGERRRRVEAQARRVPVQLLLPLVACILPSLGLLTVVPVAAAALRSLSGTAG